MTQDKLPPKYSGRFIPFLIPHPQQTAQYTLQPWPLLSDLERKAMAPNNSDGFKK